MSIKRGDVVCHSKASQWGVGKVVEVTPYSVSVHFNDGITRKIVSSHFGCLLPAQPALFLPSPEAVVVTTKASPKGSRKAKA